MPGLGLSAVVLAALFTGAALYINVAEHPARMALDPAEAARQWAPAYRRGYAMQATLAVLAGVAGGWTWWSGGDSLWLAGAVAMIANWPWTLAVMMPVNHRLGKIEQDGGIDDNTSALLDRWARLHAVRTTLGAVGTLCFALALASWS